MAKTETTRKFVYFGKQGMQGGLSTENAIATDESQMTVADNVLIATAITRKKRGGQEKYHTGVLDLTPNYPPSGPGGFPIRGSIEFWRTASMAGNPVSDLFMHQNNKVWSVDDRNTPGVDRTGALILNADAVPCYQPFNGKLYFCSTVSADGYNKWDGVSATAVAAVAPLDGPGKYITEHLGRMVMAGNDDFPFRVYLSSALDPEDWTDFGPSDATSLDLVDDGDPEGINGIASFQNRLYAWTRRSLYEITGTQPDDFIVQRVSNGIGCISHASIVQVPNDVIFASDRGVHSLRQVSSGRQTEAQFLSRDIQRLWVSLLNAALYFRIKAVYDETINCYVVTVPSSGQLKNDQILTYNIEFGTWTIWPNMNARTLAIILIGNKKNLFIGKEDGTLVLANQATISDFGAGYAFRFKTGTIYPGGDLGVERIYKSITVLASTTTPSQFTVSWLIDGVKNGTKNIELTAGEDLLGSTFILGQSRLGVGQYLPKTVGIDDIGYGIQIEIVAGGLSDIEFYGFILEVEDANPNYT